MEAVHNAAVPQAMHRVLVQIAPRTHGVELMVRRIRRMGNLVRTTNQSSELRMLCDSSAVDMVMLPWDAQGQSAVQVLPWLARHHPTVPVVLISSAPTSRQVAFALDLGVTAMLGDPHDPAQLKDALDAAWTARDLRLLAWLATQEGDQSDRLRTERSAQLDQAVAKLGVVWQTLVSPSADNFHAAEALVRAPSLGGDSAGPLLTLARELGRSSEIDAAVAAQVASVVRRQPDWSEAFVNTEPQTVRSGSLHDINHPLTAICDRVVLDLPSVCFRAQDAELHAELLLLRSLGFRFAANDLDLWSTRPGQTLALRPEFVKIAMSDLRQCASQSPRSRWVIFLLEMLHREHTQAVAVGVSKPGDRDLATSLGLDLLQGHAIGRPQPIA